MNFSKPVNPHHASEPQATDAHSPEPISAQLSAQSSAQLSAQLSDRLASLMSLKMANPVIAALDVDSMDECLRIAYLLTSKNGAPKIGALKVGPRLCIRYGASLIQRLSEMAPVFVDNKYFDIPSTMESAIRATFEAGATLATVHAGAGPEALCRLAKVEAELNQIRPFKILAVTILTSFSQETLPANANALSISDQVERLARSVAENGLTGLVCSSHEAALLRKSLPSSFLVTPGVRMPGDAPGDQKRIDTPADALRKGATALVVGRPIIESSDPVAALIKILSSIQEA